jgi:hypothetical protein
MATAVEQVDFATAEESHVELVVPPRDSAWASFRLQSIKNGRTARAQPRVAIATDAEGV